MEGALDGDFALVLAGGLAVGLLDEHAASLGLVDLCDSMQALVAGLVSISSVTHIDTDALQREVLLVRAYGGRVAKELLLVEVGVVGAVEPLERVQRRVAQLVQTRQLHLAALPHRRRHVQRHHAHGPQFCWSKVIG